MCGAQVLKFDFWSFQSLHLPSRFELISVCILVHDISIICGCAVDARGSISNAHVIDAAGMIDVRLSVLLADTKVAPKIEACTRGATQ